MYYSKTDSKWYKMIQNDSKRSINTCISKQKQELVGIEKVK